MLFPNVFFLHYIEYKNISVQIFLFPQIGDNSQLKPLKRVGNQTIISDSIFDLPISQGLRRFTIQEQYRCNRSNQTFLGEQYITLIGKTARKRLHTCNFWQIG